MRGGRDWYPRGSPQGMPFPPYRNLDEEFYMKEQMYKSEKPSRPPYQRGHEVKSKRRSGGEGDYHGRSRHSETEMADEPLPVRTEEDKRQGSPSRGRSRKTTRRHEEKQEKEINAELCHC